MEHQATDDHSTLGESHGARPTTSDGTRRTQRSAHVTVLVAILGVAAGVMAAEMLGPTLALIVAAAATIAVIVWRSATPTGDSLADAADLALSAPAGWEVLRAELKRSRRYGRHLILISMRTSTPVHAMLEPDSPSGIAGMLQRLLRPTDHVWVDGDLTYILLPECDKACAEGFLKRTRLLLPGLRADTDADYICFPDDGTTLDGLLATQRRADTDEGARAET